MGTRLDLIGYRYHRLTVLRFAGNSRWECQCDCGRLTTVSSWHLRAAKHSIKSCGCLSAERLSAMRLKHGMSEQPEYWAWLAIKQRCYNVRGDHYDCYGGRGIQVCDRWLNSFENFFADVGHRPSARHSLDRIDFNGNYEPSNVRWATKLQQANNTRTNSRLTWRGDARTLAEWSRAVNIRAPVIWRRLRIGWSIERALTTPVGHQLYRKRTCAPR